MPSPSQIERLLRDASLRVTAPRKAVLAAVYENPHADTETLLAATRSRLGSVSHQAVYDVLRALHEVERSPGSPVKVTSVSGVP